MSDPSAQQPGPAPMSRAERQAETRDQLLDAALEVFTERGFHGASLDEIARRAGYTKGAVYANFAGKDELFLAVIDRRIDRGVASMEEAEALAHTADLPDGQITAMLERQFQIRWALLAFESLLYAVREKPELLEELGKRYQQIDAATAQYLREKGADPPESIDYLAIGQSALGEGLMIRHMIEPERISLEVIGKVYDAVFDPAHRRAWQSQEDEQAADDDVAQ